MLADRKNFSEDYIQRQQFQARKWAKYFVAYGYARVRLTSHMKVLIRGGIPGKFH
jgi:hypothetical protein